jgi:hypothetical protein
MINKLSQRFDELSEQAKTIAEQTPRGQVAYDDNSDRELSIEILLNWRTKAGSLLLTACGPNSEHYKTFLVHEASKHPRTNFMTFSRLQSIFEAAHEDFDGGYLLSVRSLVQAEVFVSELEQASELLEKGYKLPAAVIAGTVLETHIRTLCERHQIPHGKLDKMNADLVKAGVYSLLKQKRITSLADIRNNAAHGKPDEFTVDDVKAMISEVERFLDEYA